MSLSDEVKKRIIEALREAARKNGRVNMNELDQLILDGCDGIAEASTERPSGGGLGKFTLTITGLPVPSETMTKIWKEYLILQRLYYENELGIYGGSETSTGQTLGRTGHRNDTNIEDNKIEFQFPEEERLGDKQKRRKTARENQWKLPSTKIQRGPRKGQTWKPPKYNEVAGYIENMKDKPIMLTDLEVIKLIIVHKLAEAM